MEISAALAADLAALTQALDDPDDDLEVSLRALSADLERAVASFASLTLTLGFDGHEVSYTVHDGTNDHATSLLIPLVPAGSPDAQCKLIVYASVPGALIDLAADLSYSLGIDLSQLVLDGHLGAHDDATGVRGLTEHSAINQAIGVLIDRGHTPESALAELQRLAARDHAVLRAAADAVLRSAKPDLHE